MCYIYNINIKYASFLVVMLIFYNISLKKYIYKLHNLFRSVNNWKFNKQYFRIYILKFIQCKKKEYIRLLCLSIHNFSVTLHKNDSFYHLRLYQFSIAIYKLLQL